MLGGVWRPLLLEVSSRITVPTKYSEDQIRNFKWISKYSFKYFPIGNETKTTDETTPF